MHPSPAPLDPVQPARLGGNGLGWYERLNGPWHERALQFFMVIVLAHWGEHLVQAFQIFGLGWERKDARGILGHFYPWLVASELLHYAYALVMLIGLWMLRRAFTGLGAKWWLAAFWIQFWHHIEHGLLQGQFLFQHNLFGKPVPVSLLQMWIPRVELHLFYNTIVFVPMLVGMYYHLYPRQADMQLPAVCSCARSYA